MRLGPTLWDDRLSLVDLHLAPLVLIKVEDTATAQGVDSTGARSGSMLLTGTYMLGMPLVRRPCIWKLLTCLSRGDSHRGPGPIESVTYLQPDHALVGR